MLAQLRSLWRSLRHRSQFEADLDAEMRSHIESRADDLVRSGLPRGEALRRARIEFGCAEAWQDSVRQSRRIHWFEDAAQDLRLAARMLRKSPGFAIVTVLTLALGVGANTAIFSVVNAVLLRPLPYAHAERLVRVWGTNSHSGNLRAWASYPDLQDWRAQNDVFSSLGAYDDDQWTWTGHREPEQVQVALVTQDFFSVLGVEPALGRSFSPGEFVAGHARVLILSHDFWQSSFASDPGVLGRNMTLDGRLFTIVGVMPKASFQFPSSTTQLWVPLPVGPAAGGRGSRNLNAIARLRPGASVAQAQTEMSAIADRLRRLYPESNAANGVRIESLREAVVGDSRRLLMLLFGVVAFVLVIACVNVANLLFARVKRREKEIAVRLAVGAGRSRVVRQLLTESLFLSCIGGATGILLAAVGTRALMAASDPNVARLREVGVDGRVLLFSAIVSTLPGLLIGLLPALQSSRPNLGVQLKESSREGGEPASRSSLRNLLVVTEVAMSLVLLVGAALLSNSFWRLSSIAPGFDPANVLTLRVALPETRYPNRAAALNLYNDALARLRALPGVESASIVSMLPLSGDRLCNEVIVDNKPLENVDCAEARMVTPDYLRTMRIPLLAGRWFSGLDTTGSPRAIVVDDSLARLLGSPPQVIGTRLTFRRELREIVGVVGNVREVGLGHRQVPEVYLPLAQEPVPFSAFVLRTAPGVQGLGVAAREQIHAVDPDLLVFDVRHMSDVVSDSIAAPRLRAVLLGSFAGLGVFLAMIGLAGVVAYGVAQRTHEFGIRLTLGATPRRIARDVLAQAMRLTLVGLAIGVAASFWLARFLSAMLFAVKPTDPATFAAVAVVLLAAALCGCYVPVRRAMRVDPMIALRHE